MGRERIRRLSLSEMVPHDSNDGRNFLKTPDEAWNLPIGPSAG